MYGKEHCTEENWLNFKNQWNKFINFQRKTRCRFFSKVDLKDISYTKNFWNVVKSYFMDKTKTSNN